jgi:hypothetical protein
MKPRFLIAIAVVAVFACGGAMCVTNPTTGKKTLDPAVVASVKQDSKILLAAANYAAPIATMVVGAYAGQDAQNAMKMASASLGTLNVLVDKAATPEQTNAAFSAVQTAWGGIDSAYKNDPQAAAKLAAIQTATEAAKQLIMGNNSPLAQPAVPTQ